MTSGHSPAAIEAVHHGVAHRAVAAQRVVTQHAVLARAQALDGALAREVVVVGAPADQLRAQRLEGMLHQQQLAVVLTALRWALAAYQV